MAWVSLKVCVGVVNTSMKTQYWCVVVAIILVGCKPRETETTPQAGDLRSPPPAMTNLATNALTRTNIPPAPTTPTPPQ
jgi:hypothetical protein